MRSPMRYPVVRVGVGLAAFIVGVALAIVLISSYLDARDQRNQALRDVAGLHGQVDNLRRQITAEQDNADAERAELLAELRALSNQVVGLGGRPVVTVPPRIVFVPQTSPAQAPPPTTTTTVPKAPPPTGGAPTTTQAETCVDSSGVCVPASPSPPSLSVARSAVAPTRSPNAPTAPRSKRPKTKPTGKPPGKSSRG